MHAFRSPFAPRDGMASLTLFEGRLSAAYSTVMIMNGANEGV